VDSVEALLARGREGVAAVLGSGCLGAVDGQGRLRLGVAAAAGASRLARRREVEELAGQLTEVEGRTALARAALVEARGEREATHERAESSRIAHEEARRSAGEAELSARETSRIVVELERQCVRLEGESSRVQQEVEETRVATEALDKREIELHARRRAAELAQGSAERGLLDEQRALGTEIGAADRAREALSHRSSEGVGVRERLVGLRRTEQAVTAARETASGQARRITQELESAVARVATLEADDLRLVQVIAGLEAEQESLRAQLDEDQAAARIVRDQVRADDSALGEVRQRRDEALSAFRQAEAELVSVKDQLQRTRELMEERYEQEPAALLDRLARNGHLVIEAELPVSPGGEAATSKAGDEEAVEDLRITSANLEDTALLEGWAERVNKARRALQRLGEVNLVALTEYAEVSARFAELDGQRADLERSVRSIRGTIARLNRLCRERFRETFDRVDGIFRELYPKLVGGGSAELRLTNEEDLLEAGIEVFVQPPGKKVQNLTLLSGGETAMVAIALIFSLFRVRPSPFCLLDEVDAPLDEANGARFNNMLAEMSALSQFIVITHNKKTMECMDTLYGVTMPQPGVSRLVTVQID
jgi:chromosome segregation protein